ncbi:hypothetical protein KUTeg_015456 [Tegillarca granosa]|uniref:Uncharacterized protein n=1 Tax=Tegillarca granosa TaxID=220873 RepID=A0ABQ9EQ47_TEGGR|nr:hypothetical protein KUTeg_015456 [Tegillarca granosa]
MASKAKLSWNKNNVQFSLDGTDKNSSRSTDILGRVSIKSTINSIKSVTLSFGHKSSGQKFQNNLKLRHNNDVYSYEGEMMNALRGLRLNTNGRFIVTVPQNRYESSWTHKILNLTLEIGLNGAQDLSWPRGTLSSSFIIRSTFETIKNVEININHEHRKGMISSALNVNRNGIVMSRFENSYSGDNNVAKTSHILQANNKEISLKSITQYGTYPLTTDIDLQWSPNEKIQVVGSLDKTPDDLINGYWKFSSSFTDDKMLSLTQNMDGEDTLSTATIQYHPDRAISMKSRYKWDNTKKIYFTLNTPYQSLRVLQTEIEFTGNSQAFRSIGSLEVQPSLRKLSISSHWSTIRGVSGNVRIDTQFPQLPYVQGILKEGSIVVKLPSRDNISARFSHSGDLSNFQSHCELSHEVGRLYQADINLHSGDLNNFQSHTEFQFARKRKYEADVLFSNNKKLEGSVVLKQPDYDDIKAAGETFEGDLVLNADRNINSKLTISTPLNGYRKLKASFVHKGSWKGFNCRANIANGKRNIEGNIKFDLNPIAALSHEGSRRNFKCHGELSNGNNKKIIGDLEVAIDPSIKFVASLLSPFRGFESMRTTMKHEASPNSFKSYADISYLHYNPIVIMLN